MIVTPEYIGRWVGKPIKRKEDVALITGAGRYIDDIRLPGMLYASILPSPYPHARIRNIDASNALRMPGVIGAVTGADFRKSDQSRTLSYPPLPPLAQGRVRFQGEGVAAVAATSRAIAEDAIELIDVEYEPLPTVTDAEQGMTAQSCVLHDDLSRNVVWHGKFEFGNVKEAFDEAEFTPEEDFIIHRFASSPIETNGVVASFDPKAALTVWATVQLPVMLQRGLATMFGIPTSKVRLIVPNMGGAFGGKTAPVAAIAMLSYKAHRPVKWIGIRTDFFKHSSHSPEMNAHIEFAVKKNGEILAFREKLVGDVGAYLIPPEPSNVSICPMSILTGCYKIRSVSFEAYAVLTNKCPTGPVRGYGRPQHTFVLERMIDIVARRLGVDPVKIRMINFIDKFPYRTPQGSIYDSGDYAATLQKAMELTKLQIGSPSGSRQNGKFFGIGVACGIDPSAANRARDRLIGYPSRESGNMEAARVTVDGSGNVLVLTGATAQGQSHMTTAAQVVADILGVTPDAVNVIDEFDMYTNPWVGASGTYSCRFSTVGVSAVGEAAMRVRDKILRIASHRLACDRNELTILDGVITSRIDHAKSITLSELAQIALENPLALPEGMEPGLESTVYYSGPSMDLPDESGRVNYNAAYTQSTHVVSVEVDPDTGFTKIVSYLVVDDCGRTINPMIVEGQLHGGVAQGIGYAISEEIVYREGSLLTSSFMDYHIPSALEVPSIISFQIENPSPYTLLGAKGAGEHGTVVALAAISNAIQDALSGTGAKVNSLPLKPERIYCLIKNNQKRAICGRQNELETATTLDTAARKCKVNH